MRNFCDDPLCPEDEGEAGLRRRRGRETAGGAAAGAAAGAAPGAAAGAAPGAVGGAAPGAAGGAAPGAVGGAAPGAAGGAAGAGEGATGAEADDETQATAPPQVIQYTGKPFDVQRIPLIYQEILEYTRKSFTIQGNCAGHEAARPLRPRGRRPDVPGAQLPRR